MKEARRPDFPVLGGGVDDKGAADDGGRRGARAGRRAGAAAGGGGAAARRRNWGRGGAAGRAGAARSDGGEGRPRALAGRRWRAAKWERGRHVASGYWRGPADGRVRLDFGHVWRLWRMDLGLGGEWNREFRRGGVYIGIEGARSVQMR